MRRLCTFAMAALLHEGALAAGAAYQVDTAEVSEPGSCKVETWVSESAAGDAIAAMTPSCVAGFSKPADLGMQVARGRSDDEYTTTATPKLKTRLVPSGIGKFGFGAAAGVTYDFTLGASTALFAYVPATIRLSNNARVNLNAGWLRDRINRVDYGTYGAGFDLRTSDNVWTLTGELFGQAVAPAPPGANQPRYQLGVRYRPIDPFNVDLIYGRNLIGDQKNWLTVATVIRFR